MSQTLSGKLDEMNQQLLEQKETNTKLEKSTQEELGALQREYDIKIQKLLQSHEEQFNDLNIRNKLNIENISNELHEKERENFFLRQKIEENEKKYQDIMEQLNKENDTLHKEVQYIQEQNTSMYNKLKDTEMNLINTRNENEVIVKSMQRQREEIARKGEEIIFLQNSLTSMKNTNT